jgi:CRP/FNR family transcriptional regulator, cyclic AMP receptor protein
VIDVEALREHSLFGGISLKALKAIAPLLTEESYVQGNFIVHEGEHGGTLHFIVKGSVEVVKRVPDGGPGDLRQLAVLATGSTFGEMELIDIQCCAASVRALEDVKLLALTNADMYRIYEDNLETFALIVMNIAREISRRLRRMDEVMASALYLRREGEQENSSGTESSP